MKTDDARVLWETHKYTPIVSNLTECTAFQKHFFMVMASKDITYREKIDARLIGITKGLGVEFKNKKN